VHVDAADLLLHHAGVDLTHVAAAVRLFHLPDVQIPRALVVLRHRDARVVRHHLGVKRQDGLVLGAHPTHLRIEMDTVFTSRGCILLFWMLQ